MRSVRELTTRLAEALAYVHAHGFLHRDIKPANILLDHGHEPRLADFGISRALDGTIATATGAVVGTAAYLAPEQVRGGPVEPAADVFALGLVLLEALTGRLEYPGTVIESATARLHRSPVVPHGLPWNLTELLKAMTDLDPAERPTAAAVAAAALTTVHSPNTPLPTTSPAPLPDPTVSAAVQPRHRDRLAGRTPVLVIAGLLLAVLLGSASLLMTTAHLNAATPPAKALAPPPSTLEFGGGSTTEPAASHTQAVPPPAAPNPADVGSPASVAPVAAYTRTGQIAGGNDHAASVERVHATDHPQTAAVEDADGNANGKGKGDGNGKQKDEHGSNAGKKSD